MNNTKAIPVVMDPGALSDAARLETHAPEGGAGGSLPGRAPVFLRVGGTEISEAQIAREMQHHRASTPHQSRAGAARALVVRELLRREAERLHLSEQVVPIEGETPEEACIRELVDREVRAPVPDEAACRRYYEANRERLHEPDRVRVRHILLAASPSDSAMRIRAAQLGEELIPALRSQPERFTEFAMRHSACQSREQGGELGWIERGDTVPEFDRQLFMLKPGLVGLTVETRYGHHVVEVLERIDGEPLAFEGARRRVAAYLETQARQNALHQYLGLLAERYGVRGLEHYDT